MLRECAGESRDRRQLDPQSRERILELLAFFEMTTSRYEQVRHMPRSTLTRFVKMGSKVASFSNQPHEELEGRP